MMKKPDWQIGKVAKLQEVILKSLTKEELTQSELAKEFGHVIKSGKKKGQTDVSRVVRAIKILESKNLVKDKGQVRHKGKGPSGHIFQLTEKGILSLMPFLSVEEFQRMLFLIFNEKNRKNLKLDIHTLRATYEKEFLQLDRNYLNSVTFNKIITQIKNPLFVNSILEPKFLPVLKILSLSKRFTESTALDQVNEAERIETSINFHDAHQFGFSLSFEKNRTYELSLFGFLVVLNHIFEKRLAFGDFSAGKLGLIREEFHEIWDYLVKKFKFDYNTYDKSTDPIYELQKKIIKNYGKFLPRIFNKKILQNIPLDDVILILNKLYFHSWIKIDSEELDENIAKILILQAQMDENLRIKLSKEYEKGLMYFYKWRKFGEKRFPETSYDYTLNNFRFLLYDFEYPQFGHSEFIKILWSEKTDLVHIQNRDSHAEWLDKDYDSDSDMPYSDIKEREKQLGILHYNLENLFKEFIEKIDQNSKSEEYDKHFQETITELVTYCKIKNSQEVFDEIISMYRGIKETYLHRIPITELLDLQNKASLAHDESRTTHLLSSEMSFYLKEHYDDNGDFKILQNIIEFQFFTCVKGYFPSIWIKLEKDKLFSNWYQEWISVLNNFKETELSKDLL